jgi:hypothetical protein
VFRDHEPSLRRHDQALGRDEAVRGIARVLVHQRERRHELADQAERGVDIEMKVAFLGNAQDLGKARAFDVVRNQRQRRRIPGGTVHAAHPREVDVPEIRQPGDPLPERKLERGDCGEGRVDPEDLYEVAGRGLSGNDAVSDPIGEKRRFRSSGRRES